VSDLVVDTSSWISWFAGAGSEEIGAALDEGRVILAPVVAAELLSGGLPPRRRRALESLLADLPVAPTGLTHWFRVGSLRAGLRRRGLTVSTPDAHVAQCALDLDAELLSEDEVFGRIAALVPLRRRTT
jgi:predicted nucleic acid-binding protein